MVYLRTTSAEKKPLLLRLGSTHGRKPLARSFYQNGFPVFTLPARCGG